MYVYNVKYFRTSSMCIFNTVKKQSGIGFIIDALFGNFVYLYSLYAVIDLHTNNAFIHFERQQLCMYFIYIYFCSVCWYIFVYLFNSFFMLMFAVIFLFTFLQVFYADPYVIFIIGHYNPSVRIIEPVSHTTYVCCACVNFCT